MRSSNLLLTFILLAGTFAAQTVPSTGTGTGTQTEADEYTRYELLAPETASFRIRYEVTATTPGANFYFNPIRRGSVATEEAVIDAMTGQPLKFEVVSGQKASKDPLLSAEDRDVDYIKVHLARPVPANGGGRIVIVKTYRDAKSYFRDGDSIVFDRPLSIKSNSVVLPAGYELTACNVPSQVLSESDGRIKVSFMNAGAGSAPLVLRAKMGTQTGKSGQPAPLTTARSWESPFQGETEEERLAERAHSDRNIVYELNEPRSHSFAVYHDLTESRPGIHKYLNVVRSGSRVSNPSAVVLDTGAMLSTRLMTAADLAASQIDVGERVPANTQIVLVRFAPVAKGQSIRLRIAETYTDPVSYTFKNDELVFDRSLGRARNAVVLPSGWYLTASSIPCTVSQLTDGRVRLDFWNGRPDPIAVLIKAKLRN
jgi:hypothetical protein